MKWKNVYEFIDKVRSIPRTNKEKDLAKFYAMREEAQKEEEDAAPEDKKRGE